MIQLIEKNKDKLIALCKSLGIKKMNIFGSSVSNKFTDNSDIDFLILFSEELSIDEYTENYFKLHYKLRKIFNRNIDIVTEQTLSNPFFIESINNTKELIYEA